VDEDDPDSQTLLVWYPTVTPLEGYVRQAVKIESGAKSALDPNCETTIRPYLADDVASLNLDIPVITTVVAERTFWDEVIIIHGQRRWFERRGELQHQGQRVSRHYYDVYRLLDSDAGQRALADSSLSQDCGDMLGCFSTVQILTSHPPSPARSPSPLPQNATA